MNLEELRVSKREELDRARLLGESRRHQCVDERRRASVHDRRLGGVELDLHIVDATARHGRQHVLLGVHGDGILAELCASLRENGWNISRTAEVIHTPRSNLYKKIEHHKISREADA